MPAATSTTDSGAPSSQAAGGSATVAAIDASDTYRVTHAVTRNSAAAAAVAPGDSMVKTPAATATPLPP